MGVALDSSVIVAFLDADDVLHAAADRAIRNYSGDSIEISAVAYAELLVGAGRGHHARASIGAFIDGLQVSILPLDIEIAEVAAELRTASAALRLPDALILATAAVSGTAGILVTGDRRLANVTAPGVRIHLLD